MVKTMNALTFEKIREKKEDVEKRIKRLDERGEYYDVFTSSQGLGMYLSTIDSLLMVDKIDLDEYNDLFRWYSEKSSEVLKITMDLDHKLNEERRNNEAEQ